MEGKYAHKLTLESTPIQIPIKNYEQDFDIESWNEKKQEILNIFTNLNNIGSEKELNEIENNLHKACKKSDFELIKILLSETIDNESKLLTFKIDRTNQTASLFRVNYNIEQLTIPRTVKYESVDYLITSICYIKNSYIKEIKFAEDSAVKTIYGYLFHVFFSSNIKEIYFPASLKELKEGWCEGANKLTKIIISPSNKNFMFKDDKYLIGKSDENNDEFDILLFSSRDIDEIEIPSNIKIISSYAFYYCSKVARIEISTNSNLQIIGSHSFESSCIKEIFIPSKVSKICQFAFHHCYELTKVEIAADSNLQIIESNAFDSSHIKEIFIPSTVTKICEYAFYFCRDLTKVKIEANSNLQTIESKVFYQCEKLENFDISTNSNLQKIESGAFAFTNIKEIYFPASFKELEEGWCNYVNSLTKIIISPSNKNFMFKDDKYLVGKSDENNDEFDILLFSSRDIDEIEIPSNIKIISSYAFYHCFNLARIEIPTNSNLQIIGSHSFESSCIKEIFIPSKVSKICKYAFYSCKNLTKVDIAADSILQTIESYAFTETNIKEIFIPSTVTKICESAFIDCNNLTKVEIPMNSNLQKIESGAFAYTNIKEIYFPASLKELKEGWCEGANKLTKIIISPSNKNFMFKDDKYLIGKSDENNDEFDILLFSSRDIDEIEIPSNIKIISSYAFYHCFNLARIEIPTNSNLQIIGSHSFESSCIKEIFIPSKVSKICQYAFCHCYELTKVEIAADSNLQTIESNLFEFSKIKEIFIPSKVSQICKFAFSNCKNLTKVKIPTNSNLQIIESYAFEFSNIEKIFIPSKVSKISIYAFNFCVNLLKIEIPTNSNLQTIESNSFGFSNIKGIFIPSTVSKIDRDAFSNCQNLQIIEIADESKLESLSLSAFSNCSKFIIMIPSSLKILIQ